MKLSVQPARKGDPPRRGKFPDPVRNWPHPGRPGWPHNYDQPGYFCVEDPASGNRYALLWDPVHETYDTGIGGASPSVVGKFTYLGPCSVVYRSAPDPTEVYRFRRARRM